MSKKHKKWNKDQHRPDTNESPSDHSEAEANMVYTVRIQPDPSDETRHTEQRTYQQQQIQATKRANLISGIAVGIAGLTLTALVIYACITYKQLTSMRAANDISYKSLVSVQRAFVNLLRFDQTRFSLPKGHMLRITAIVENSGTTPAVPAINYVNIAKLTAEPDEKTFRGNDTHFISFLAPLDQRRLPD